MVLILRTALKYLRITALFLIADVTCRVIRPSLHVTPHAKKFRFTERLERPGRALSNENQQNGFFVELTLDKQPDIQLVNSCVLRISVCKNASIISDHVEAN